MWGYSFLLLRFCKNGALQTNFSLHKDNGMYSDIVLRGGKLRNDMDSYGEYPDKLVI